MAYDAFISYSHSADGQLAPALQRGLQRLAKPWYRPRALRVFRDETGLSVNPHLWGSIEQALDQSSWFVLLCSPDAAASPWVTREIEHWLRTKPAERILLVLTEGSFDWADRAHEASALPAVLADVYKEEPRFLDLRWARDEVQLDLKHARFRAAVAELAAPMHGIAKDDLESEDVRVTRRARRLARMAAAALALLTAVAILAGVNAVANARRANREADHAREAASIALARQLAASARNIVGQSPDRALLLAVEGYRMHPEFATADALARVLAEQPAGVVGYLTPDDANDARTVDELLTAPDGHRAATLAVGGTIRVWDLDARKEIASLAPPDPALRLLAWSGDSRQLAWTSASETHVWSVDTDEEVVASDGFATAAAFAPDQRTIALARDGQPTIVVTDGTAREIGPAFPIGLASALAWSADGSTVARADIDPNGQMIATAFDVATGTLLGPEPAALPAQASVGSQAAIVSLQLDTASGTPLITAIARGAPNILTEWDATTGQVVRTLATPDEMVANEEVVADVSANGALVATISPRDQQIRVRTLALGELRSGPYDSGVRYSPGAASDPIEVTSTAFALDDAFVLAGTNEGNVRVFSVAPTAPMVTLDAIDVPPGTAPLQVVTSPDGSTLAVVGLDSVTLVTLDDGTTRTQSISSLAYDAAAPTFLLSDSNLLVRADGNRLLLWDAEREQASEMELPGIIRSLVLDASSRRLAVQVSSETLASPSWAKLVVVDLDRHATTLETPAIDGFFSDIAWDGDEVRARAGASDGTETMTAWDVRTGASRPLEVPPLTGNEVKSSADGSVSAFLNPQGLFVNRNGDVIPLLEQPNADHRWPFAIAHDGELVASFFEGAIRVWSTQNGLPLGSPRVIPLPATSAGGPIVFSNDDDTVHVVVVHDAFNVVVAHVDLDPERWTEIACALAGRVLSPAEWARDVGETIDYQPACPPDRSA